jgi:integrase
VLCRSKAAAHKLAEDRLASIRRHGTELSRLPANVQREAAVAWEILHEHGIGFVEAANAAVKALRPAGGQVTLAFVLKELRDSKDARYHGGRLDKRTREDFSSRSLKIETALGSRPIHLITPEELRNWLQRLLRGGLDGKGSPLAQRTVLNYRNVLAEVFAHAARKRYCPENPLERLAPEEYKALGGERAERDLDSITALEIDEARKLLSTAATPEHLPLLGSLVLRLFCGLRTAETCKLDWSEVHWTEENPYVHIPAGKAKKRRIRHVEIPGNAVSWLKFINPPAEGRVTPGGGGVKAYVNRFAKMVKKAGVTWDSNDTRHSYGSYHYALHGDALKTASQLGHKQGDDVLFAHYRALVSREKAREYFNLVPPADDQRYGRHPYNIDTRKAGLLNLRARQDFPASKQNAQPRHGEPGRASKFVQPANHGNRLNASPSSMIPEGLRRPRRCSSG